jgi:hypothetical protein
VLSERFGVPQLDVDDFYWMPTDPPLRRSAHLQNVSA